MVDIASRGLCISILRRMPRDPLAVLVSGSGTNLQAILDAAAAPGYAAEIVVVISDRPGVRALERAEAAGVPAEVVAWSDFGGDRDAFTAAVCDVADKYGATGLVLAGFMRILAPVAIERFPHRILNTHPALLPAFPGGHAVEEALDYGVKVTGVTFHFVDEQVDHGPIVWQGVVPMVPGDTVDSLTRRIQEVEHRHYPEVVAAFAAGRLRVDGRTVFWSEA